MKFERLAMPAPILLMLHVVYFTASVSDNIALYFGACMFMCSDGVTLKEHTLDTAPVTDQVFVMSN